MISVHNVQVTCGSTCHADTTAFFFKAEWWVAELLFLSLNNWGLNFLQNESSQFSQIYLSPEKLSKVFTFQSYKWLFAKLSKFTKMTTIFTQIVVLSENRCHFVNLLSFASSYIFLSLRKLTWLNSQDVHLRTQNEEPSWVNILKSCWTIFFHVISQSFQTILILCVT